MLTYNRRTHYLKFLCKLIYRSLALQKVSWPNLRVSSAFIYLAVLLRFSEFANIKTKLKNKLHLEDDLQCACGKTAPNITRLVSQASQHKPPQ